MENMSFWRESILAIGLAVAMTNCGPNNPSVKALTGATLIDGTGAAAIPDAVVVVNGNDIQTAGPASSVTIPSDARKIDLRGKFLIPGLVDVRAAMPTDAAGAAPLLRKLLKAGITSVGLADGGPALRDESPRTLAVGEQVAGIADLVIASDGSSADGYFAKVDHMAKAEVAPAQILAAATKNGALWLKQERLGVLTYGHKADLVVLNADPLQDVHNLRKVDRVMLDGSWIK